MRRFRQDVHAATWTRMERKTCNCSHEIVKLKTSLALLEKRLADIEESQAVNKEDMMLRCPGLHNPTDQTWMTLQKCLPRHKILRLMRRSSSWRKLVTNLICAIFPADVLIQSSVTGRNTTNTPLDPVQLNAILDFVTEAFPQETITVSEFNHIILTKIKNVRYIEKMRIERTAFVAVNEILPDSRLPL